MRITPGRGTLFSDITPRDAPGGQGGPVTLFGGLALRELHAGPLVHAALDAPSKDPLLLMLQEELAKARGEAEEAKAAFEAARGALVMFQKGAAEEAQEAEALRAGLEGELQLARGRASEAPCDVAIVRT